MVRVRLFVDALGRAVYVPHDLQRVVSLVPSLTEALFDFGWGANVVGMTEYCTEPAAEMVSGVGPTLGCKTTIGGTKNPDIPQICALKPDVVFAVAEENRQPDVEQLDLAGIPVYVFDPRTVRDGIDLLWRLAEILDCRAEVSPRLEAIEADFVTTQSLVAQRQRVRVFCPIWKDPYMTINADTYVHDMLWVSGGVNIFARRQRRFPLASDLGRAPERPPGRDTERDRRYPRVTLEEMAALQPEIILLPDEPYVFGEADRVDFSPFVNVPAVREGRIHLIDGKIVSWYGPRIGRSLHTLRELLRR